MAAIGVARHPFSMSSVHPTLNVTMPLKIFRRSMHTDTEFRHSPVGQDLSCTLRMLDRDFFGHKL
jgi:hypothetical protein